MNQTTQDFIDARLTTSPQGNNFVSLLTTSQAFDVMELVKYVQSQGPLCQTIDYSFADSLNKGKVVEIIGSLIRLGVVVIFTCDSLDQVKELRDEIEAWKLKTTPPELVNMAATGRFFILVENTNQNDLDPIIQNLADYSSHIE